MRHAILVLTVALVAGITQARADQIVTYHMTGTLRDTSATVEAWPANRAWYHLQHLSHPYAAGDHITWTLRYDSSTADVPGSYGSRYEMQPNTPVITNIVDQTTGYHFPVLPNSNSGSILTLIRYATNSDPYGNQTRFSFEVNQSSWHGPEFGNGSSTQGVWLQLNSTSTWKETSLANLHLDTIPFAFGPPITHNYVSSYLNWVTQSYSLNTSIDSQYASSFGAIVDSFAVSVASTPEPGTLTLFLLGAAGLSASVLRRRLRQVGETSASLMRA
jgi:hypothetical protein